jgi:Transglycosylase SLT domain
VNLPPIPSHILKYIKDAAQGTGLPISIVAAQNYVESGYGSNLGPSSAGAEGPWQFEPGTWGGLTTKPFSSANNWDDSTPVYVAYMNQLLKQEHGNVRDTLAAYNAGPGNKQAGYGYADRILGLAGQATNLQVATGSDTSSATGGLGGILSIPSDIVNFFKDADSFVLKLHWLFEPSSWLRIGSFFIAIIFLVGAIIIFTRADEKIGSVPLPMPVPV